MLDDFRVGGEAYRDALDLAGIGPSPLEQFTILPLIPIKIGDFSFSFTNPSLFMMLTLGLVLLLLSFMMKGGGGEVSAKCLAILGRAYS
ncbi:ATP synthase subunit a [Platanthera zijinensis]|uniref:ATP synthase subunit a n=1 Tax=Platanthera zijinensis TaxID=2320716 RepID=A0AAP0BDP2_9ASPA